MEPQFFFSRESRSSGLYINSGSPHILCNFRKDCDTIAEIVATARGAGYRTTSRQRPITTRIIMGESGRDKEKIRREIRLVHSRYHIIRNGRI